jgi:hypothetical protein
MNIYNLETKGNAKRGDRLRILKPRREKKNN